ncbi:MAG: lactate utilization protein [Candidatus Yonathbacteria bacterium]|nr:lactate utilization protein [Candidatus Yonathbacteria bacterium]
MSYYERLASDETIKKTVASLKERNINAIVVATREEALKKIKDLIPRGAGVMNGSSVTLQEIGFVDYLKNGKHGWNNIHEEILNEKNSKKKAKLRKQSIIAPYFLGSVHAITEGGQVVVASASGSQMPSYAFSSDNVIWVAGAQKIVPDLDSAMRRLNEFVIPLENKRMQSAGYPGTVLGRILIFEREIMPNRHITLILVKEKLGF